MKTRISKSKLGGVWLEMETVFVLHTPGKIETEYRDDLCKAVFDYGTAMAKEISENVNRPSIITSALADGTAEVPPSRSSGVVCG
jgi:hypothetical protein